ncbi:hypothetical protein [Desulfoluna spongiiphila]|uniref:Uncharacterized protein n=1 Tax=Desulfoluna spongiiphila TaxID=419481 RepID=A0A1G5FX25_9BACT|nr:hypothetical protein [Desulfoluna spongiiphila]SCY43709.1 hypothetical protein SAMN05216233_10950 [Desulfoluna spongiiphila]
MAEEQNETTDSPKPKKLKKILFLAAGVLLLAGLGAGGWFGYTTFFQSDYPKEKLAYVDLDKTVLKFTWTQMPEVYRHMVNANAEMALMKNEIDRIRTVGKSYPRQKKIVASEIKRWEKNVRKLSGQLKRFQGQVEALYVTFRVNPQKGRTDIFEKSPDLAASLQDAVSGARSQTDPVRLSRIPLEGIKGIIAKVKSRFL